MQQKKSLDTLTGLRFIAALIVFIHHLGGKFGYVVNGYSIGSLAVTFFFVLSGFILTYAYQDRLNCRSDVTKFYFNRFARIWPLHLVCLLIAILLIGSWTQFRSSWEWIRILTNLFLLQSWVPKDSWVFSFNGVAWSISTETFFYLCFPLLVFGKSSPKWRLLIAMILAILSGVTFHFMSRLGVGGDISYYRIGHVNPLIRLPEFCSGIIAARIFFARQRDHRLRPFQWLVDTIQEVVCVLAIVLVCFWVVDLRFALNIGRAEWGSDFLGSWFRVIYPTPLFAIAVYVFAKSKGWIARCAASRGMVYLGEVSFAFYMIH
ncbi:MAG: acyltransferase, partial [Planctomycetota bacterium]